MLPKTALSAIVQEALNRYPDETGGILMGAWESSSTVILKHVIGPGSNAVHLGYSFEPDQQWQEQQVASAFRAGANGNTYLGDWHSHPAGSPEMSPEDGNVGRLIALSKAAKCPEPIILIIGVRADRIELGGSVYREGRFTDLQTTLTCTAATIAL